MSDDRNDDAMHGWVNEPEPLYKYMPPPVMDLRDMSVGHVRDLQIRVATLEGEVKFLKALVMELLEGQAHIKREIHVIKYPCD